MSVPDSVRIALPCEPSRSTDSGPAQWRRSIAPVFPIALGAEGPSVEAHAEEEFLVATTEPTGVAVHRVRGLTAMPVLSEIVPNTDEPVVAGIGASHFLGLRSTIGAVTRSEGLLFTESVESEENSPPRVKTVPEEVRVVGGQRFVLEAEGEDDDGDLLVYEWCEILEEDLDCRFGPRFEGGTLSLVAPQVDEPRILRFAGVWLGG